ncbi:MAG: DUF4271 domain-containing protein, partial [Saprospiraceae bacterium]
MSLEKEPIKVDSSNPFEIINSGLPADVKEAKSQTGISKTDTSQHGFQFPAINAPKKSQNFLFIVLLIYFGLLTALVTLNRSLLGKILRGFFNENYLRMMFRVQNPSVYLSYALIYLFFVLNAGLFVYLLFKRENVLGARTDLALFFWCVLGLGAIYGLKHLILRLIGAIFPVNREVQFFGFTLLIFNSLLGLLLLPVNAVLAFAPEWLSKYMIPLGLILFVLVYFYRQLRGLLIGSKYLTGNPFHFFVYLCTVEIAPIIIL